MDNLKVNKNEEYQLIMELIKDSGYKITSQRGKILLQFIKNKDEHISAEKVYNRLKNEGIGFSTVYRNINLFVNLGILKEFKIDETSYYELKIFAKKPLHIHFMCEKCGSLVDIKDRDIILKYLKINNIIEKNYGIQINDADIMLHGLCKDCIEKAKEKILVFK